MKGNRVVKVVKIMVMVAVAIVVFGFVIEHLWNWLMPAIFGLRTISFVQALGLLVLSKILFGGFHRHSRGGRGWKNHMKSRWEHMSPDERERFRTAVKGRWGCHVPPVQEAEAARGGQ